DVAVWSQFTHVAGVNPALLICNRLNVRAPIAGRDVVAAHQNLAAVTQLQLLAGNSFANRSLPCTKRMRQAGERSSLGHPVALNHCIAESSPKTFSVAFESCATSDEGPKAPTKSMVCAMEGPPVSQEVATFRCGELRARNFALAHDLLA